MLTNEPMTEIFNDVAKGLDVSDEAYSEANARYQHLAKWIERENETADSIDSRLYSQGSVRLGTLIRPVTDADQIDLDAVYRRDLQKTSTSQLDLKTHIGEQLARYIDDLKRRQAEVIPRLMEGRRCWTLKYTDMFHMDVLPALPDSDSARRNHPSEPIWITDTKLTRWQSSDPKGFSHWFYTQMETVFEEEREMMAKAASVSIEQIPTWKVKTPLQRSVQILKRHRDQTYKGEPADKPISIIISTLAAKSYRGERNLTDALINIVRTMGNYIEIRNGEFWIGNPVNDDENFADKWKDHPHRAKTFQQWQERVTQDLEDLLSRRGLDKIAASLTPWLGKTLVESSLKTFGQGVHHRRQNQQLTVGNGTAALGAGSIVIPKHTFFGE
jgi:hypothetical protein